jgi:glycine betaine catabolism B
MSKGGFQKVANKNDIKEGGLLGVDLNGNKIVLAMVNGQVFAIDAVCSHQGGPLEEGTLEGFNLTCPWHYAVFDVRTGKVSDKTVWAKNQTSYPVNIDENTGDIFVNLERTAAGKDEGAAVVQRRTHEEEKQDSSNHSEKRYYEEEQRKASNKVSLELLSREKLEGTDIMTFRFSRNGMDFDPGQYAFFSLDGVSEADSKGAVRHFSIASSPTEQGYLMVSTRIRDSPYKQRLSSLEIGAKITAWGPQGEFVLHDDNAKPAVLLSGGIGVTPFRSMLRYATDKQLPIKIILFDSNRNQQSILYRDEFDKWAGQNKNMKIIYTITEEEEGSQHNQGTTWAGEHGRIDKSMIGRHLTNDEITNAAFYVCGPPGMLKAMQDMLQKEMQIPKERLKVEAFTGY